MTQNSGRRILAPLFCLGASGRHRRTPRTKARLHWAEPSRNRAYGSACLNDGLDSERVCASIYTEQYSVVQRGSDDARRH